MLPPLFSNPSFILPACIHDLFLFLRSFVETKPVESARRPGTAKRCGKGYVTSTSNTRFPVSVSYNFLLPKLNLQPFRSSSKPYAASVAPWFTNVSLTQSTDSDGLRCYCGSILLRRCLGYIKSMKSDLSTSELRTDVFD